MLGQLEPKREPGARFQRLPYDQACPMGAISGVKMDSVLNVLVVLNDFL